MSTKRPKLLAAIVFTLAVAIAAPFLFGVQASADDDDRKRHRVNGSYEASFSQFDLFGFTDGFGHVNGDSSGPFELMVGGETMTGEVILPVIVRLNPDFESGTAYGSAAWIFDDGPTCVGALSGELVPAGGGHAGLEVQGRFECTDGSVLRLRLVETAGPPESAGTIAGSMTSPRGGGDDDDDEDDD